MKYNNISILLFVFVGVFRSFTSGKAVQKVHDDNHWDYLILSQFWPQSSCIYFQEKHEECYIPPKVKGWTIHGLWPSRPDSTLYPHDCDASMPFDMNKIQVLRPKLDLEWHYYNKDGDPTYLWNHEWTKHGTCAFSLPALRGELTYFNKTLELHSQVNLTDALAKSNVLPSNTMTYKREDFFNAVMKYYKFKPFVVCDFDRNVKKSYVDQIYLCYDKSFNMRDCYPTPSSVQTATGETHASSYYTDCEEQDNIYYLPYNNQDNDRNKNNQRKTEMDKNKFSSSLIFTSESRGRN